VTKLFFALGLFVLAATAQEPIRYTVRFPAPQTHHLEVEASLPARGPETELFLAVWTPGSYLVREYARFVEDFSASASGKPLKWEKSRKNRWKVASGGAARIDVKYKVYANELSVQGNFVDADFAMLNGAPNFVTLVGGENRPYEVKVVLPAAWKKTLSGLKTRAGEPGAYVAADFDELLDCPIYAGNAPVHEFEVMGKRHFLVNEGEGPMWDGPASAQAVKKIVERYANMFGSLPYDHYVFFNILRESGGGLEHKNSTWLGASKWAWANTETPPDTPPAGQTGVVPTQRRPSRAGWLGLVSHEYFHLWNVKRFRPAELGPFDYENENYTRSLWISEGFTTYFGGLTVARTGLVKRDEYLRTMSRDIRTVQDSPARLVQSLEDASFDAWIRLYRPSENLVNTNLSYYPRGAVVAFLLDAKIRKMTENRKSLNDVMVEGMKRFSGTRGFTPADFRKLASDVSGGDLTGWLEQVLERPGEYDYTEALEWYGLRFRTAAPREGRKPPVYTGISTRTETGRLLVAAVRRDSPAWHAGINVGDEILALNEYRVRPEQWPGRLDFYNEAQSVRVLVSRRDELRTIELPIALELPQTWTLEVRPDATEAQKANLKAWLE
jgi:predicted metalloprotease with PDZ domain